MPRPINQRFVDHCRTLGYSVALPDPDTADVTCPRCGVTWRFGNLGKEVGAREWLLGCRQVIHLEAHPAACRGRFPDPAGPGAG